MGGKATLNGITMNHEGWRKFLLGDEIRSVVQKHTNAIASRAGEGFNPTVYEGDYGGGRWVGAVHADTYEAIRLEAEQKTLTKAVG